MKEINFYCDGACKGNGKENSIGGWGSHSFDIDMSIYGGEVNTTNNRMELLAAIRTIQWIIKEHLIDMKNPMANNEKYIIHTDSSYVVDGITSWIIKWKIKDYKGVKNPDLWQLLDKLNTHMSNTVEWKWVKGHSDNEYNNRCDALANQAMDELID